MRFILLAALLLTGCAKQAGTDNPELAAAAKEQNALEMADLLEQMIDAEQASDEDRQYAYDRVASIPDDGSVEYAFARAAITGRLAELRGLSALFLIKELEGWAMKAAERDPQFREGAARQLLGTVYVVAGPHVAHGNSEKGLEMLEELVDEYPGNVQHKLRLAEGYINLGDPGPALEFLCEAVPVRQSLRPTYALLLERLLTDVGGASAAGCGES